MNVLNMFQEEDRPEIKPATTLEVPPTYKPVIPTNMEQAQEAIIGETPQFNAELSQAAPPEPTREEQLKAKMDEMYRTGINPMVALIDKGTPQLDEQKAKRLKFAAATNALGQGLSTLFGGVMGAKGGPILEQKNEFTPAALAEYNNMIAADKEAKYRNAMSKSQLAGKVFEMANSELSADDQRKFQLEVQKNSQDFQKLERQLDRESAEKNAGLRSGLTYEERNALVEKEGQMKLALREATTNGMLQLENLRQSNAISKKEYDLQMKQLFEDYKAGMKEITTQTTGFSDNKETKTTEKVTVNPNKSKANPKTEKSEAELLKELGITTKGKLLK